jgi:hypothetical protein
VDFIGSKTPDILLYIQIIVKVRSSHRKFSANWLSIWAKGIIMKHINERTMSKYFDGELGAAESAVVEEHLEGCARCREAFKQLGALSNKLDALPAAEPSPYFASRVKRAAAEKRNASLTTRVLIPIAATAATLASLVIGGYLGQSIYSQWVGNGDNGENGYVDYFDVSPMQDYPEGSFGEVFTDLIPEEVSDEG